MEIYKEASIAGEFHQVSLQRNNFKVEITVLNVNVFPRKVTATLVGLLLFFLLTGPVSAHVPYFSDEENSLPTNAFEIDNIHISKVIYQRLTEGQSSSWIKFEGKEKELLYLEVGLPSISKLYSYRPHVTIYKEISSYHSDFTKEDLKPVLSIPTEDISSLKDFYEPFTGTNSWILTNRSFYLPADGTYYIESFNRKSDSGKLWLAIGKEERFGASDIANLPFTLKKVKEFHLEDETSVSVASQNPNLVEQIENLHIIPLLFLLVGFFGFKVNREIPFEQNLLVRFRNSCLK